MKDTLRQISVILTILATIVVNGLANALPINGLNTGEISDRFRVYFVPAGYVFSIWGLIYLGLVAFAIFQALPSQRENPRLRATGWWISLGGLANIAWIFLWHYQQFPLTLIAMLVLLATLIITYLRLGIGETTVPAAETWAVRLPFSIYLGWITVATVANVTSLLDFLGMGRIWDYPRDLDGDCAGRSAGDCGIDEFHPPRPGLCAGDLVGVGRDFGQACLRCSCGYPYLDHLRAGSCDTGGGSSPSPVRAENGLVRGGLRLTPPPKPKSQTPPPLTN